MELHAGRSLGVGEERLPMQEQDQFGPLPQLVPNGPAADDGLGLSQEIRGEFGAIRGWRTGHGAHPVAAIAASIRSPRSLPRAERAVNPYSYF
jgi:hypothetical protein